MSVNCVNKLGSQKYLTIQFIIIWFKSLLDNGF